VDVAQPERDGDGVEGVVAERQQHTVAGDERKVGPRLLALGEHAEGEVAGHDGGTGGGERRARGAGAGGEVEDQLARPRIDHPDDLTAPATVLPQRQHVVRQVVTSRDVVEHPGDVTGLLVQAGSRHRITVPRVPWLP
jgi:hypothetical protein